MEVLGALIERAEGVAWAAGIAGVLPPVRRRTLSFRRRNRSKPARKATKSARPIAKCRRERRRRSVLLQRCAAGQRDRTAAHIWHARRMHMRRMWGKWIPLSHTFASLKSTRRALKGAALTDMSYMDLSVVSGAREDVDAALLSMLVQHSPVTHWCVCVTSLGCW